MFQCGLIHCETSSWFIRRGGYSSNIRTFFTIFEQNFNLRHEIILLMDNDFCSMNTCDVCQNNKFTIDLENGPLIDLKLVRKKCKY